LKLIADDLPWIVNELHFIRNKHIAIGDINLKYKNLQLKYIKVLKPGPDVINKIRPFFPNVRAARRNLRYAQS
jgi:hypothetical protein